MPEALPPPASNPAQVSRAGAFDAAWQLVGQGRPEPLVDDYLPPDGGAPCGELLNLLKIDIEYRVKGGGGPCVPGYLSRYPELSADAEGVASLFAWELDLVRRYGPPALPGYEVLERLGSGGTGVVYKARQKDLNRLVALKVLLSGAFADAEERARFRGEAQAVAHLQHPNIVQVFEVGEQDGRPFFSMELIEGGSLGTKLQGQPRSPRQVAQIVETLARAVQHAHDQGVVHRDLKPGNVLVDTREGWVVKVCDFGLAKKLGQPGQTATFALIGTPAYMAPEQTDGNAEGVGPETDVYGLGAILYECLTGRPPFQGKSLEDVLGQVRSREPAPPSKTVADLPRDLETICLKCLQKEPRRRYAKAADLADDLGRWLDGRPIAARPAGRAERLWLLARRRPVHAALWAALLLVVALSGAFIVHRKVTADALRKEQGRTAAADTLAREQSQVAHVKGKEARESALRKYRAEYIADMKDAPRLWALGAVDRLRQLVDRHDPARRGAEERAVHGFELGFWRRMCQGERRVIQTGAPVRDVAWSRDGKLLASVSGSGGVTVWGADDGRKVCVAPITDAASAAFGPGGRLAIGTTGNQVAVWDVTSKKESAGWRMFLVPGVAVSPDGNWLVGADGAARLPVWDLKSGKFLRELAGHCFRSTAMSLHKVNVGGAHTAPVLSVAFSPDGKRVASGGRDRSVKLWESDTGKLLATLQGHEGAVSSVAFSPDGRLLASACGDTTPHPAEALAGRGTKAGDGASAEGPAGRPASSEVRVWDLKENKLLYTARPTTRPVPPAEGSCRVAFSPDGQALIATGDRGVRAYHARTGRELYELKGHAGRATSVAVSPDGKSLASGGVDGTVRTWAAERREGRALARPSFPGGAAFVTGGVAPRAPDGKTETSWVVPTPSGRALLWSGSGACFSPDGRRLAAPGEGGVKVWERGRAAPRALPGSEGLGHLAFSGDGELLAGGSTGGDIKVWDVGQGRIVAAFRHDPEGGPARLAGVAFRPDGGLLASAGSDGTLKLWNVSGGRLAGQALGRHEGGACAVLFSRDGRFLASGGMDRTARLWDVGRRRQVAELRGHRYAVSQLAFTPDGSRLCTACGGENDPAGEAPPLIKMWELGTNEEVLSVEVPGAVLLRGVAFSPDGSVLAAAVLAGRRVLGGGLFLRAEEVRLWESTGLAPGAPAGPLAEGGAPPAGKEVTAGSAATWAAAQPGGRLLYRHPKAAVCLAISHDGQRLASAGEEGEVKVWDLFNGRELRVLKGEPPGPRRLLFSRDGKSLLGLGRGLTVWAVETGQVTQSRRPPPGTLTHQVALDVAFPPTGPGVLAVERSALERWTAATASKRVAALDPGGEGRMYACRFSPDGSLLAGLVRFLEGGDQFVIWSARDGRLLGRVPFKGGGWRMDGTFSADGRWLAITDYRGGRSATAWRLSLISVWDALERREKSTIRTDLSGARQLAFSPDGERLAAALAAETKAVVWDVRSGRVLGELLNHSSPFTGLEFTPDGKGLVTASPDGAIRLWGAPPRPAALASKPSTPRSAPALPTGGASGPGKRDEAQADRARFATLIADGKGQDLQDASDFRPGWRIEDRALVAVGKGDQIITCRGKQYRDFHLRAEVKLIKGKAVVAFRSEWRGDRPKGYSVGLGLEDGWQCRRGSSRPGAIFEWAYKSGDVRLLRAGSDKEVVPVNTWFTVEVTARGNKFSARINGKLITEATDAKGRYDRGYIGFVAMQGSKLAVRRVEVRELSDDKKGGGK